MLKLTLVTPEKRLVTDLEIEEVFVPAMRGELNILPGHAPLMTTLQTGILRYRPKDSQELKSAAIGWGYCEIFADAISIMAESAEFPEEIDRQRAEEAMKRAEKTLEDGDLEYEQMKKYQAKLQRAIARMNLLDGSNPPTQH